MSTGIRLLVVALAVVAFVLHVVPSFVPVGMATVQHVWAPIALNGIAVLLAIGADCRRYAERGR